MMYFKFLPMMLFLFGKDVSGVEYFPKVTYKDLENMYSACEDYHSCVNPREYDDISYNCNCAEFCAQFDTCCVDSKYRDQYPIERKPYNCIKKYGQPPNRYYHMVDRCDSHWSGDNLTVGLCEGNAEELDNIFLAVPVTNSKSGISYKNHYCAVCHDDTDEEELLFWTLQLGYNSQEFNDLEYPEMHFNSSIGMWTYVNQTSAEISLVVPSLRIPNSISKYVHECFPGIISKCAENWTDPEVEAKCKAYMAAIFYLRPGARKDYRNPHCALCNHEEIDDDVWCTWPSRQILHAFVSNTFFVRIFSLYDKTSKCEDPMVYDTLAKKCRKTFKGK